MANLATAIEESGAEIVRPHAASHGQGDPTLLTMLWQNLIGNAVKFRRPDRDAAYRDRRRADDRRPRDKWEFSVSDNGIGIAEEFADKVFVIFQRLHGRDAYAGTGIGLALCKKIVEYHGGTIWIDTSYTDGTRFRFTLPAVITETSRSQSRKEHTHDTGRSTHRRPAHRGRPGDELITREAFEHNKIKNTLHVAHDGEEGLDFLYRRGNFTTSPRPDLILLDLNLPKYDGRQLLEKIKSDPDLSHIPVVVLTHLLGRGRHPAQLQTARQRLCHQAG